MDRLKNQTSQKDAKEQQRRALSQLLFSFANRVIEIGNDPIKLHAIADEQAIALANVTNAQTTAALVSFHILFKKELSRIINEAIDQSGQEVIQSFSRSHKMAEE